MLQSQYESWSRSPCLSDKIDFCRSASSSQPGQSEVPTPESQGAAAFRVHFLHPTNSSAPARWVLRLDNSNSLDAVPSRPAPKRLRAAARRCHVGHQSPSCCVTFLVKTSNPTLILESGSKDSAATRNCWFRKGPTPPLQPQHTSTTLLGPSETAHCAGPRLSPPHFLSRGLGATLTLAAAL